MLGDSVSTLIGCNPPDYAVYYDWNRFRFTSVISVADTWWGQVTEALGGFLLENNSYSGSMVCKHPDCEIESYGCSDERTGRLGNQEALPDVIMILLGLNDFGSGRRLYPSEEENGISVFSDAYDIMLKKIRRNYPEAEIWCLTLPCGYRRGTPAYRPPLVRAGHHLTEYNDVIRACAENNGCKLLDIFHPGEPYESLEGYHPNANGMKTIASHVLCALEGSGAL